MVSTLFNNIHYYKTNYSSSDVILQSHILDETHLSMTPSIVDEWIKGTIDTFGTTKPRDRSQPKEKLRQTIQ